MVQSICDCSAVQSAVCLSKCLAAAPVFLIGATRHVIIFFILGFEISYSKYSFVTYTDCYLGNQDYVNERHVPNVYLTCE